MPRRRPAGGFILWAGDDRPLIGVIAANGDVPTVEYFVGEEAADAALGDPVIQEALALAGAWSDLDWQDLEAGLDRLRHESQPTPPLSL